MGRTKMTRRKSAKPAWEVRRETVVAVLWRNLPGDLARLIAEMDEENMAAVQLARYVPPDYDPDDSSVGSNFPLSPPPPPPPQPPPT